MIKDAAYWIDYLKLSPHPEGGYYKEVFRSLLAVQHASQTKQACTSIYYLLEGSDYSGFHRLKSDEIWYFHKGAPLNIYVLHPGNRLDILELSDTDTGSLSVVIPANLWFAADIPAKAGFALASCAVAPGFDFNEFEMADADVLAQQFPMHQEVIERLSR